MTAGKLELSRRAAAAAMLSLAPQGRGLARGRLITPIGPTQASYAQACLIEAPTRWLFVSGQTPTDADGRAPDAFDEQARLAWRNVEAQLRAAGMTFANLAKVTIFLADRRYREANTRIRRQLLGALTPAITVVIADIFDQDWLLEIEAIACA